MSNFEKYYNRVDGALKDIESDEPWSQLAILDFAIEWPDCLFSYNKMLDEELDATNLDKLNSLKERFATSRLKIRELGLEYPETF